MDLPLFLGDADTWTQEQLDQIVEEQLDPPHFFSQADCLRTAVMYCPLKMTPAEWVKACKANGIRESTARNRYSEVRRQQREDGEI